MYKTAIILILVLAVSANGATYYISNSGNDDSSGTSEVGAWQHVVHACTTMTGGDSLLFMGGTYAEQGPPDANGLTTTMLITDDLNGTSSDPTVFKVAPGYTRPTIKGYATTGYDDSCDSVMAISTKASGLGTHWMVFDSLIVKHSSRGIQFWSGSNVTFQYVVACSTGAGLTGINNNGGINVLWADGFDSLEVAYCSLFTNREEPDSSSGGNCGQIELYGTHYSRIHHNVMFDGFRNEGLIFIKGYSNSHIEIDHNVLYGADYVDGGGIMMLGADSLSVHHNIIYDCQRGIIVKEYETPTKENAGDSIYNNTIYNTYQNGLFFLAPFAAEGGRGMQVFNNIVMNDAEYDNIENYATNFSFENDDKRIDYNCYYNSGSSDVANWGANYTLANLIANVNIDSNSVNVNPNLADPDNGDFNLTGSSPASVTSGGIGPVSYMGALAPDAGSTPSKAPFKR